MVVRNVGGDGFGPVPLRQRALAPDLARGFMLLGIALANSAIVVAAGTPAFLRPAAVSGAVVESVLFVLVHARSFPLFAFLFGYGLVQFASRLDSAGFGRAAVQRVLVRRNVWLAVFGFAHAALLFYGDILTAYGLLGVLAVLVFLRLDDRLLGVVWWLYAASAVAVAWFGWRTFVAMLDGGTASVAPSFQGSLLTDDFWLALGLRLWEWPQHTVFAIPAILGIWLGMWAARRRWLEEPERHVKRLWLVACGGVGLAVASGVPLALIASGVVSVDAHGVDSALQLHNNGGIFAGPGLAAVFGLVSVRLRRWRRLGVVSAVAALGRMSLSAYLFQSVVWLVVVSGVGFGLAESVSHPVVVVAGLAVGVWLCSVVAAAWWQRRGYRGPAELLLRRLSYGARGCRGG